MPKKIEYTAGDNLNGFIFIKDTTPTILLNGRSVRHGIFICPYCKKEFRGNFSPIKNGTNKSCGCYNKSGQAAVKHGLTGSRIMKIWVMMKMRCYNKNYTSYPYYGGKGITVCEAWIDDVAAFNKWALINGYSPYLTLDRIDGTKEYCPANCRWTTQTVQNRNRGINSNNKSGFKGVYFDSRSKKYAAQITVDYKTIHLGYFNTAKEGARAYNNYIVEQKLEHLPNEI